MRSIPTTRTFAGNSGIVRGLLDRLKLRSVIETGARFLLDPLRKHRPTLVDPPRQAARRLEFLERAVAIGPRARLRRRLLLVRQDRRGHARCASSGTRLLAGCRKLADYAAQRQVRLAFEPEPGMFIDTMPRFAELRERLNHPALGLTLDVGHLHCLGEVPITEHLRRWRDCLWNIHIEDMRRGVHDHLMFGEGEIDFDPVLRTLRDIGYNGGVHVELSRHSHDAVETARRALRFLQATYTND